MNKFFILFCFVSLNSFAQTILNTESLFKEIDSTYSVKVNAEADFNFGNIELIQFNNSLAIGKRFKSKLIRVSFGYEYISEDKETIANDWSGQLRINHFFNKNSLFLFLQGQNVISLKLNYRYLLGSGYRHRFIESGKNYFDFSAGFFLENELYQKATNPIYTNNFRYSFSAFSNLSISDKIILNTSLYYQINSASLNDFRVYLEPRLYFDFDKISFYINNRFRYHSTPYIDVLKSDNEFILGIEIDI